MGKSSSSRKKRSKYSSLDRGQKRSKTKRAKPRKHRCREDSDSESYSTDDSRSSPSVSLSSEDSYRGRKSRSSIRKDTKEIKRRARSCSTSSDESFRLRKKKGSRRKVDSQVRKKVVKRKKKKKSKRDASISSRSSESSSESSDESEYESRHRGRSERRKSDLKSSKNAKGRSKKRRYRSRSCSSCSRDSDGDYWREKKVTDGSISKRLKSIITVVDSDKEEREPNEYKEEIVYEDDGYPSSRSNDSYGAGDKRSTENEESKDLLEGKPTSDEFVMKDSLGEKINEIAEASGDANEDLETILRQKALENLKRFRGQKQISSDGNAAKKDESGGASRSPCLQQPDLSQNDLKNSCDPGIERDSAHSLQEEKILDSKNGSNGPTSKVAADMREKEKENKTLGHEVSRQRLVTSALKQAPSNSVASTVEAPKVKSVNKSCIGEPNVNSENGKTNCDNAGLQGEDKESSGMEQRAVELAFNNASGSNSAAQDMNPSEGQAEVKEGSQLEKKTMSVMRGGELVQVSYKVYIPQKAPAVARRQLKR